MKKIIVTMLAAAWFVGLTACGGNSQTNFSQEITAFDIENGKESAASSGQSVTLKVASEYSKAEPVGVALEELSEAVNNNGESNLEIVVYPDGQLGGKVDIIDSLLMGEPVIVGADPAFLAEYGAPDLGIMFGPFLFDSTEEVVKLTESEWFQKQCQILQEGGLHVIDASWVNGVRHLLTNKKVILPADMTGMKIRVPSNQIQTESFNILGATATAMDLSEVYTALQTGTIDGGENPLSTLYNRKFQEVSKYLLMTGHVRVDCIWIMSEQVWNQLTSAFKEQGPNFNQFMEDADDEYLQKFIEEGVMVTELTDEERQQWIEAAKPFYDEGSKFGWSEGLYDQVLEALGKK